MSAVNFRRGTGFYSKLSLEGSGEVYGIFTNNHVLSSTSEADNAFATFGYEDASGGQKVKLRPEVIFRTNKVSLIFLNSVLLYSFFFQFTVGDWCTLIIKVTGLLVGKLDSLRGSGIIRPLKETITHQHNMICSFVCLLFF